MKLFIAPSLVLIASFLSRRFGNTFGGWLIALPLTSAPAAYLIAGKYGFTFAHQVIVGMMFATISQIIFAFFYYQISKRHNPALSLLGGVVAFALSTSFLSFVRINPIFKFILVVHVIFFGSYVFRNVTREKQKVFTSYPLWDIPVRVITAATVVFVITEISPHIGANLAGLLSPFPVLAAVLAYFTHISEGMIEAQLVLKGLIMGLLTPASFFFVLAEMIQHYKNLAFLFALLVALLVQFLSGKRLAKQSSRQTEN